VRWGSGDWGKEGVVGWEGEDGRGNLKEEVEY